MTATLPKAVNEPRRSHASDSGRVAAIVTVTVTIEAAAELSQLRRRDLA